MVSFLGAIRDSGEDEQAGVEVATSLDREEEEENVPTTDHSGLEYVDSVEETHSWIHKVLSYIADKVSNISHIIAGTVGDVFAFLKGLPALVWPSYF